MLRISPCLWFNGEAEEAIGFYVDVFPNSRITRRVLATEGVPNNRAGDVLTVEAELDGVPVMGLNGGPEFTFSEAISLMVDCADQKEVDYYWDRLREGGGKEVQCGWLKDRFGLSWQVVPRGLMQMHADPDPAKRQRVMDAMMKMVKLDLPALEAAYRG